jgi:hypothetical protein
MSPDFFKLVVKALVIADKAQLMVVMWILFECPIGG